MPRMIEADTSAEVAGWESTATVTRSPLAPANSSLCMLHIGTLSTNGPDLEATASRGDPGRTHGSLNNSRRPRHNL